MTNVRNVDRLAEEVLELDLGEDEELGSLEELEVEESKESKEKPKEVPEQYKGKTTEELIAMNSEAQKQISRQGNEIGELRRLTDQILQNQLEEKRRPKAQEQEPDWEYHPKEAAEQLVNSKVSAIEAKLEEDSRQRALRDFEGKHPNYREETQTDEFKDWVSKSVFRSKMYVAADKFDFQAADELFTEWEEVKESLKQRNEASAQESTAKNKQVLKEVSMEKGGNSGARRKIYRRADLINLRLSNPQKFDAMYPEIQLAYREGRVK